MAIDKREQILARLFAVLRTEFSDLQGVWRDRGDLPPVDTSTQNQMLPAAVLLDGKEETLRPAELGRTKLGMMPPTPMLLLPQIFIVAKPNPVTNAGISGLLSSWRIRAFNAIINDSQLKFLVGTPTNEGLIEYRGCDTDMQTGSTIQGTIQLHFGFVYVFNPADLQGLG